MLRSFDCFDISLPWGKQTVGNREMGWRERKAQHPTLNPPNSCLYCPQPHGCWKNLVVSSNLVVTQPTRHLRYSESKVLSVPQKSADHSTKMSWVGSFILLCLPPPQIPLANLKMVPEYDPTGLLRLTFPQ